MAAEKDNRAGEIFAELLWLVAAAGLAWLAPRTFLAIQLVAGLISISLYLLERKIMRGW